VFLTFPKSLCVKQQAICVLLKNVKIIPFDQPLVRVIFSQVSPGIPPAGGKFNHLVLGYNSFWVQKIFFIVFGLSKNVYFAVVWN